MSGQILLFAYTNACKYIANGIIDAIMIIVASTKSDPI